MCQLYVLTLQCPGTSPVLRTAQGIAVKDVVGNVVTFRLAGLERWLEFFLISTYLKLVQPLYSKVLDQLISTLLLISKYVVIRDHIVLY